MRYVIVSLVFLHIISACAPVEQEETVEKNENTGQRATSRVLTQTGAPRLGLGYDSENKSLTSSKCVNGFEVYLPPVKETLEFTAHQSNERMRNSLYGSLDSSLDISAFSLDAGGKIDKSYSESDYVTNYTIYYRNVSRRKALLPFDPTMSASILVDSDYNMDGCLSILDSENAVKTLGDEFVNSIELGGYLRMDLAISASSKAAIDALSGQLKINVGSGFYLDVEGAKEKGENLRSIDISFRVSQFGGRVEELVEAFPDQLISCTADEWQNCTSAISNAVDYAFNNFANQFSGTSSGAENVLSFTTIPYSYAGFEENWSLSGADRIKQVAVLLNLRKQYDDKLKEYQKLSLTGGTASEIAAVGAEITTIQSDYALCQNNTMQCNSAYIN